MRSLLPAFPALALAGQPAAALRGVFDSLDPGRKGASTGQSDPRRPLP